MEALTDTWAVVLTIVGVGIALSAQIRSSQNALRRNLNERMDGLAAEVGELRKGQGELRERMAHLEGLLDGLREAATHNRAA